MTTDTVLLVWHGSKDEEALQEFHTFCGKAGVNYCFLNYVEPLIPTAVSNLVQNGVKRIRFIPYFLFKGIHVRKNIPLAIEEQKRNYPHVEFILDEHIGINGYVVDTILDRFDPKQCDAVILVACGSREHRAKREIRELADKVSERIPDILVEPCFISNTEPNLSGTIQSLQGAGISKIAVVPVMLFAGKLLKRADKVCNEHGYVMKKHLGMHAKMIQLVWERCLAATDCSTSTSAK